MAKKGKMQLTIDNAREAREISLSPRKTDAAIGIKYAIMEGIRSIGKAYETDEPRRMLSAKIDDTRGE